jgi:hypothetical protein
MKILICPLFSRDIKKARRAVETSINKVKNILEINRSSFNELPIEFPPLFFSHQDKLNFIKELVVKYD